MGFHLLYQELGALSCVRRSSKTAIEKVGNKTPFLALRQRMIGYAFTPNHTSMGKTMRDGVEQLLSLIHI